MARQRYCLVATECRRCGKPLMTGSRSLHGADSAKSALDRICEACITPAEREEIERAVNAAVQRRAYKT